MEQLEVIWESTEVATRKDNEWNVKLFSTGDFYIEVWYFENGSMRGLRSFTSATPLEAYIDQIDLPNF